MLSCFVCVWVFCVCLGCLLGVSFLFLFVVVGYGFFGRVGGEGGGLWVVVLHHTFLAVECDIEMHDGHFCYQFY